MATQPQIILEVLAHGEGHSVARVAGNKMPILILCPTAIAELRRVVEAAATRAGAIPNLQIADAFAELVRTFEGMLSNFQTESNSFGRVLLDNPDRDEAARDYESELKALIQLGESSKYNDSK
jgi:hypothetical protein